MPRNTHNRSETANVFREQDANGAKVINIFSLSFYILLVEVGNQDYLHSMLSWSKLVCSHQDF